MQPTNEQQKFWESGMMKKRSRNAKQERAGVIAVEQACNKLDLIWRRLLEEDVGMDGTMEIALGEFPTGKIVGVQIKSGESYLRSETDSSFRFYPNEDDLVYWRKLSIPLFLLVHHPRDECVYWVDISRYFQSGPDDLGTSCIIFSKANVLDSRFERYLHDRFDLTVYTDEQYAVIRRDLETVSYVDGNGAGYVNITALDLFVEGLWGLCSKLQFHSSLLADLIRKTVRERDGEIPITYAFDRATLYPFFNSYFGLLTKFHLAVLDAADINESLYVKLEYPTFIAPLTTNGRRFVEYLRRTGVSSARDHQYMSLSVRPHVQIEIYSSFTSVDGQPQFGPFTDVLAIGFNAYLDYYRLAHWQRDSPDGPVVEVASQNIHYHALQGYIANRFDAVAKNNLLFRYFDIPLSPLICWLEHWNENPQGMPTTELRGESATEVVGFADELVGIIAPAGVVTIKEPPESPFPRSVLANGEKLLRT